MSERPQNKHLVPCKPGETHNPNGRPKNMITELSERLNIDFGVKLSKNDKYQLIENMIERPLSELKKIAEDEKSPVFMVSIASAVRKDIKAGHIATVELIFNRVFGKATQKTDITSSDGSLNMDEQDKQFLAEYKAKLKKDMEKELKDD